MIFYFSGTGNSRWVAEKIAEKIDDKSYDISKLNEVPEIDDEKQIGLVFPVYAWGVPEPMNVFAKELRKTEAFTFGICTCASEAGLSLKRFSKIYHLDSSYSVTMPSNYIIGEDIEKEPTILKKIEMAGKELEIISDEIIQRKKVYRVNEGTLSLLKSTFVNKGFDKFARTTSQFYVDKNRCISCGLCERNCPASTITLVDGNPLWNRKCYQCLRCINYCPKYAIQYGKRTEARGRYNIEKYLK